MFLIYLVVVFVKH